MEDIKKQVLDTLGLSESVGRFLLCFFATIPCSYIHRFIRDVTARHAFAAASGIVLSYCAFGVEANLYCAFPLVVAYLAMRYTRRQAGLITFLTTFAFLIFCHVTHMSGDMWKEGGMDFTGALMILTLKVISVATDYQDGAAPEDTLKDIFKSHRLEHLPSLLEFLGYSFCLGTHLTGPVILFKDYLEWQEFKGIWSPDQKHPAPPSYRPAGRAFLQGLFSCAAYLYTVSLVPLSLFTSPEYKAYSAPRAFLCMYIAGLAVRWKYYFVWSLAEGALVLSGLGFSGWKEETEGGEKPKWIALWTRAKNCDILGVEFADSAAQFPLHWNISVSNWLRVYVYERLTPKGKKSGFWELMETQVVSAIWHGLYPGYLLYFTGSALMIGGSRVIYRFQKAMPAKQHGAQLAARVAHGLYASFVNNYACMGFLLLSVHDTLMAWRGVYYSGTWLPLAICILGSFVKPPRPPAAKKEL